MEAEEKPLFKVNYTDDEIKACYAWYEQNMDRLPQTMKMPHGISLKDTRKTAINIIRHLQKQSLKNITFNGEFAFLLLLREHIRKEQDFQENPKND